MSEDRGGATLSRSGAAPTAGASAGELLARELGLAAPIPLEAVRDWLRGLPGAGATDVRRDADGRLETLLWSDASGARWFARVRRWTEVAGAEPPLELPSLLTARSGDRRLRLALSDWRLGPDGVPGGEGGADGTPDGGADGSADGGADGSADGTADGTADGAGPGTPSSGRGRLAIPGR